MKIDRLLILPAWLAFIMSIIMSGAITAINTGAGGDFLGRWGHAWIYAWPLATLSAYAARPLADKLTTWTLTLLAK
jgi:hypothetical protein